MSQNSLVLPTTGTLSGLQAIDDINAGFDTLNTLNSGGSAPSTTEADMLWMDTTNNLMKQRDGGNANWYPQWLRGVPHGGGLRHSGQSALITSSTVLTFASCVGQMLVLNPTASMNLTFPAANAFPAGTGFMVVNYGVPVTLVIPGGSSLAGSETLSLGTGDQCAFFSDGSSVWHSMFRGNVLSQSLSGSNWAIRQAGGVIEQCGSQVVTTNSGGGGTIVFTETFPNNVCTCVMCAGDNGIVGLCITGIVGQLTTSNAGFQGCVGGSAIGVQTIRVNYIAKGN